MPLPQVRGVSKWNLFIHFNWSQKVLEVCQLYTSSSQRCAFSTIYIIYSFLNSFWTLRCRIQESIIHSPPMLHWSLQRKPTTRLWQWTQSQSEKVKKILLSSLEFFSYSGPVLRQRTRWWNVIPKKVAWILGTISRQKSPLPPLPPIQATCATYQCP